ncbi:2-methylisocitrate lyase [Opitutaceae bacterium EW11]|nr:2-methylisocitrate lyase [Opitutaceae bacterium EW11]
MSISQAEKGRRFLSLHQAPGTFVIPNPWDAGSARLLAALEFSALATSSAAIAGSWGRRDYGLCRDEALARAREIVEAVDLPVSADLEDGFGRAPEAVAETVRLAIETGLAGCSIEDAAGDGKPLDLSLATERVAAAVEVARKAPFPFLITARAENYCRDCRDLADTIARLQAYERAGADVLFAPGVPELASVRAIVGSVSKPLNVVGTMQGGALTVAQLAEAGVKRISLAAALYRAALTGLRDAAAEVKDRGTFTFAGRTLSPAEQSQLMR